MADERVQVNDPLRRKPERTVLPIARDVFVRAPSLANPGGNMADLANALSSFSGSLGRLGGVFAAKEEDEWKKKLTALDALPEDRLINTYNENFKSGDGVPGWVKLQAGKAAGIREFHRAERAVSDALNNGEFDPNAGVDLDEWAHRKFQAHAEASGVARDPGMLDGFRSGQSSAYPRLQQQLHAFKTKEEYKSRVSTINNMLDAAYLEGTADRAAFTPDIEGDSEQLQQFKPQAPSVEQRVKMINDTRLELRREIGKGGGIGSSLAVKDIDESVMRVAASSIENGTREDIEVGLQLAFGQRPGDKGENIPAIALKADKIKEGKQLLKRAVDRLSQFEKQDVEDRVGATVWKLHESGYPMFLLKDEKYKTLDGKEHTISKNEMEAAFWERWKAESQKKAAQRGETPEVTALREAQEISAAGIVNKDAQAAFDALPSMLNPQTMQRIMRRHSTPEFNGEDIQQTEVLDPEQEKFMGILRAYQALDQISPALAKRHVTNADAREFLETYQIFRKNGLYQSDDAALGALAARFDPNKPKTSPQDVERRPEWQQALRKMHKMTNGEAYAGEVQQLALKLGTYNGISPDKAIKAAQEAVAKNGVEINGYWSRLPSDANGRPVWTPAGFEKIAQNILDRWYDENVNLPGNEIKRDEITMVGMQDGTWRIINKATGVDVPNLNPNANYAAGVFTVGDLVAADAYIRQKDTGESVSKAVENANIERLARNGQIKEAIGQGLQNGGSVFKTLGLIAKGGFKAALKEITDKDRWKLYDFEYDYKSPITGETRERSTTSFGLKPDEIGGKLGGYPNARNVRPRSKPEDPNNRAGTTDSLKKAKSRLDKRTKK